MGDSVVLDSAVADSEAWSSDSEPQAPSTEDPSTTAHSSAPERAELFRMATMRSTVGDADGHHITVGARAGRSE